MARPNKHGEYHNPLYTENQGQLVTAQLDTYRESCPNTGKRVDNDGSFLGPFLK